MSRCNSPIPEIIVCPVSSSDWTLNVGSSSASFWSPSESFSSSALDFGSIATDITGSGKVIDSNWIKSDEADKVSPVLAFLSPTPATISPAQMKSISSLELECILKILPSLSSLPVVVLVTLSPLLSVPE